jgi:hypothetical protein
MEEYKLAEHLNLIPTKKFFSDTLLIALLTGVGYFSAFLYQYSYLRYFGVPYFFIEINAKSILLAIFSTISVPLLLTFILNNFWSIKAKNKFWKNVKIYGLLFIVMVIYLLPIILLLYLKFNIVISVILPIAIIAIILFIKFEINNKSKKPSDEQEVNDNFLSKVHKWCGTFPILFVLSLIYFIYCSYSIGSAAAKMQAEYLVSHTNPPLFVVSTYSGNFICLSLDNEKKTFGKNIIILTPNDFSGGKIIFTNTEIGRLKAGD